jgi:hypothetical protein
MDKIQPNDPPRSNVGSEPFLSGLTTEADRRDAVVALSHFLQAQPHGYTAHLVTLLLAHAASVHAAAGRVEKGQKAHKEDMAGLLQKFNGLLGGYQTTMKDSVTAVRTSAAATSEQVAAIQATVGEELRKHQAATTKQIDDMRQQVARLHDATDRVISKADLLDRLSENRILWGLALAFATGFAAFPFLGTVIDAIRSWLHF